MFPKALQYKDFTLKANVRDVSEIKSLLESAGAKSIGIDHQKDTYFKVKNGKLKLRQGTIENLITHYERVPEGRLEKTVVYQYDLNPVDDQINDLFEKYAVAGITEKQREIFFIGSVKIHLDTTGDNKNFIEIEAIDSDDSMSHDTLRALCLHVRDLLKIREEDMIRTGYLKDDGN